MFRQLTGGLESVITAIVEAMPSNVHLYTGTLVSNIRYVEGMYAIDVENSGNDACGCQSHSKSIRTASINAENRVEASDSTTDSAIEVLLDKAPAMADHVIIATPPATYTQWFKDDEGFDFLRSMDSRAVLLLLWPLIKLPLMVT